MADGRAASRATARPAVAVPCGRAGPPLDLIDDQLRGAAGVKRRRNTLMLASALIGA
jgi:hypothetical protein